MYFAKTFIFTFVLGAVLLVAGGIIFAVFPGIIESKVKETVQLAPGTETYENWHKLAIPLKMEFYIFNLTNHDDVIYNGSKPSLKQVGPYVYRETLEKVDLKFDDDENTVSYRQLRTYVFDEKESGDCKESDLVIIPNVPLITTIATVTKMGLFKIRPFEQLYLNTNKHLVTLYEKRTVSELIFQGYYAKIAHQAALADPHLSAELLKPGGLLPDGYFGLFIGKNGTDDQSGEGDFTVNTGVEDHTKFARIVNWRHKNIMSYWGDENTTCNKITGTDGMQYSPFIEKDTILKLLVPEICRSAFVVYEKEVSYLGIDAYQFTTTVDMFGDSILFPENECYCVKSKCLTSGLLNGAPCKSDAPIVFSMPHFYMSDPLLLESVDGLSPSAEKHKITLAVEPTTGMVIGASRKIQVNVQMEPTNPHFNNYPQLFRMPKLVHPILWLSESATIDEPNGDKVKAMLVTPKKIGIGAMYTLMSLGPLLILVAVFLIVCRTNPNEETCTNDVQMSKITTNDY